MEANAEYQIKALDGCKSIKMRGLLLGDKIKPIIGSLVTHIPYCKEKKSWPN